MTVVSIPEQVFIKHLRKLQIRVQKIIGSWNENIQKFNIDFGADI